MQTGSALRFATLLDGVVRPQSVTGTTDGKTTNLQYTYGQDLPYDPTQVTGQFAGDQVELTGTRTLAPNQNDVKLHFQSQGKSVPVDLDVTILGANRGLKGVQEKGTIAGHKVNLTWNAETDTTDGTIDGQQFHLAGQDMSDNRKGIPWAGGTADDTVHYTGSQGSSLIETDHWKKTPQWFGPMLMGSDTNGTLAGVEVNEHLNNAMLG